VSPPRVLISYDGSGEAARAIRAVAALMPDARAVVAHARGDAVALEHAAPARVAMPDSVIVPPQRLSSVRRRMRSDDGGARACARRGRRPRGHDRSLHGEQRLARHLLRRPRATGRSHRLRNAWSGRRRTRFPGIDILGPGPSRGPPGTSRAAGSRRAHGPGADRLRRLGRREGRDGTAARLFPARETLVGHAWSSAVTSSFVGETLLTAPVAEIREIAGDLDDVLAEQAAEIAADGAAIAVEEGLAARGLVVPSAPGAWRALAATARDEGAAVVVAGCRGRGALASTVLGSVSSGLVHNAYAPVLIVRGAHG
jgi:nucleotide-binding universal stress UspA family protein